jgi:hypothetical protein
LFNSLYQYRPCDCALLKTKPQGKRACGGIRDKRRYHAIRGGALKTDFWLVKFSFMFNVPPFKSLV